MVVIPEPPVIKAIIFDCDGTLVDSEPISCEAIRRAIQKVTRFDPPHEYPQDYYDVFGLSTPATVKHYNQRFHMFWNVDAISTLVLKEKEVIYRDMTKGDELKAFKGAQDLITVAKEKGWKVGVGSSGELKKIWHNLTKAGLDSYFDKESVVSSSEVPKGKPAPDVYIEVMKRLGIDDPASCVVVEDAVLGLKAAKAAGMRTIGFSSSLPRERLEPFADLVVESLDDIKFDKLPSPKPIPADT